MLHALVTSTSPHDPELVDTDVNTSLSSDMDSSNGIDDLMVSHDRFTVYRATVLPAGPTDDGNKVNGSEFTTGKTQQILFILISRIFSLVVV